MVDLNVLPAEAAEARTAPGRAAISRHGLDSGRRLPHGLEQTLSGGGARPLRLGRRLLDGPHPGHQSRLSTLPHRHRLRYLCRNPAASGRLPGRPAHDALRRLDGLLQAAPPGRSWRLCLVAVRAGSGRAPSAGARKLAARGSNTTPPYTWPIATWRLTRSGRARSCRRKQSGNSPPVEVWTAPTTPGATNSIAMAGIWPIPGRASFHGRISPATGTSGHLPSMRFRRMDTVSTT